MSEIDYTVVVKLLERMEKLEAENQRLMNAVLAINSQYISHINLVNSLKQAGIQ